jgi:hypothetical protein
MLDRFDRFDDRTLEIATVVVVILIALVLLCYLSIFINPQVFFNPFKPATPIAGVTVTSALEPTWTPTPSATATNTATPTATWTPTATPAAHSNRHAQAYQAAPTTQADGDPYAVPVQLHPVAGRPRLREDVGVGLCHRHRWPGRAKRAGAGGQRRWLARGRLDQHQWLLRGHFRLGTEGRAVVRPGVQGGATQVHAVLVQEQRRM